MTPAPTLREWLAKGDYCLALSSGFFGFFAHTGLLLALEEAGLLPASLAGSSAGALVAGCWGAGVDGPRLRQELLSLRRVDFWDPAPGLGLLRGRAFRRLLVALLPVGRFEQCRCPVQVSVFNLFSRRTQVLSQGALAPAIHASCAFPMLFQPVWIDRRPFLDGGIADRPGVLGLSGSQRVLLHHLDSSSPWHLRPPVGPTRPAWITLSIDGLPRVGPFHLERGAEALSRALSAARKALDQPLTGGRSIRIGLT